MNSADSNAISGRSHYSYSIFVAFMCSASLADLGLHAMELLKKQKISKQSFFLLSGFLRAGVLSRDVLHPLPRQVPGPGLLRRQSVRQEGRGGR